MQEHMRANTSQSALKDLFLTSVLSMILIAQLHLGLELTPSIGICFLCELLNWSVKKPKRHLNFLKIMAGALSNFFDC